MKIQFKTDFSTSHLSTLSCASDLSEIKFFNASSSSFSSILCVLIVFEYFSGTVEFSQNLTSDFPLMENQLGAKAKQRSLLQISK